MAREDDLQIIPFTEASETEGASSRPTKKARSKMCKSINETDSSKTQKKGKNKEKKDKDTQKVATKRKKSNNQSEESPRKKKAKRNTNDDEKRKGSKDTMYNCLQIRTSPKNLLAIKRSLKPNQIKWIREIGMGPILDMKIDSIPSKLAYSVLDNFKPNKMVIKTSKGDIKITQDSVTEILGLKNEGHDIYEFNEDYENISRDWKKQFQDDKMIRQKHLVKLITESTVVDTNFKLNFIILFINTMVDTLKMGTCNISILPCVGENFEFKSINWCKYIYDQLSSSKKSWDRTSKVDFYTGPITFLTLMYLNSTKCDPVHHKRVKPAIFEWTTEKMKQREKFEIKNGGFGNLELNTDDVHDALTSEREKTSAEFLTSLNRDLEELLISKAEIEIKMTRAMMLYPRDEPLKEFKASYEELFKINENMFVTVLKPQEQEREDNREQNTEGNEGCMDNREQNTEGNRVVSEETILEKNDEEIMFATEHQQHNSGETSTMLNEGFNVKETQHEATISIQSVLQAVNLENIFTEEKEKDIEQQKEEKEKNKDTGSKKIGIQKEGEIEEEKKKQKVSDTGSEDIVMDKKGERVEEKNNEKVSQKIVMEKEGEQDKEKKEEEIKRIEEREQGSKSQQMSTQEESEKQIVTQESPLDHPSFKLGIPEIETPNPPKKNQTKTGPLLVKLKTKEKQVAKDKAEEKQKRTEKMSDKLKSPYVERSVDVTSGLFAIERRIGDWIFSLQGDPYEFVFETASKKSSFRVIFESLIKDSEAFSNVIDNWAEVLNYEERLKSSDSPNRLFCTTDVLGEDVFKENFVWESYVETFIENLKSKVIEDLTLRKMKTFDLVFFPIIKAEHFYVICFDLKNGLSHLLDNSATKVNFKAKYGLVPTIVQNLFMAFLARIKDSRMEKFNYVIPRREAMKWRTTDNTKDCSIFVMRHMETFMGGPIKNWDCGLQMNKDVQEKQLNNLRYKYLTKILLSDINMKKQWVLDQAIEFAKLPKEKRDEIKDLAEKNKQERLNLMMY